MTEIPLARAGETSERVRYDARAVADATRADPGPAGPGQVLAVLRTSPAGHSGSASVDGVFLDAATGRLVDSSGAPAGLAGRPAILRYEGDYEVLAVLSGPDGLLPGRYAWTEPLAEGRRGITPAEVYDPFARPAVVTCRYDPAAPGAPFDWVRLLPEGWQAHAAAAARAAAEPDAATARHWLSDPNDLLFARGAWALARTGQLDSRLAGSARGHARGYRRAALHYAALAGGQTPGEADALAEDLAGRDAGQRRAAALGLLAARLFAPGPAAAALAGRPWPAGAGGAAGPALADADDYVREAFALLATGGAA